MITISISKLHPHPNNPRRDLGELTELADSIRKNGILQNLTVVPWVSSITGVGADDPKAQEEMGYRVVIGHRRLAAAKLAGLEELPCTITEMDEKTQIATMLMENLQRTDLTIYEQAKGFQMMLDLGESPENISTMTGFSKTTIRRRINLLELDPVEFKKAVSRGATLMDLVELEKVKDVERKNKVLESIGTVNFKWNITQAINEEKAEEKVLAQLSIVEQYATRIDEPNMEDLKIVKRIYVWSDDKELTIPEDASTTQYFYVHKKKDHNGIAIWKRITPEEREQESTEDEQDATEQREKTERFEKRRAEIQEISTRAYKLRMEFAKTVRIPKKSIGIVLEEMAKCIWNGAFENNFDTDDLCTILEIEDPESEEENSMVKELIQTVPERLLFLGIYSNKDNYSHRYYSANYGSQTFSHENNEQLNDTYEFLERFGYQLSDEERAMRDGTHELFIEEGVSE